MSTFACPILKIDAVEKHPNAERLTLNRIGGYVAVSNLKDSTKTNEDSTAWRYQPGDYVVYIPEGAVLPEWLLKHLNMWKDDKGMLAGSQGNRVKAMHLRGILSQGVMLPVEFTCEDGWHYATVQAEHSGRILAEGADLDHIKQGLLNFDMAAELGVTKYEPPIPSHMSGEVCALFGWTVKFDIENYKRYPDVLIDGEEVVMTEKLHGTFCQIGYVPGLNHPDLPGDWFATSKGLAEQGLVFKNNEANQFNLYLQTVKAMNIIDGIVEMTKLSLDAGAAFAQPIYLLGEVYGMGVQDLTYGLKQKRFAGFDIYVGKPGQGEWLDYDRKKVIFDGLGVPMVPLVYRGPFSVAEMDAATGGKTLIRAKMDQQDGANVREGVVITPVVERRDDRIGRVILKSVSAEYLTRKGGTEYQ